MTIAQVFAQLATMPAPATIALKATVLIGLGWCAARFLRRAPAVARHLVWLTVIAGSLALPILARLPLVRLPVLAAVVAAPSASRFDLPTDARSRTRPSVPALMPAARAPHRSSGGGKVRAPVGVGDILLALWSIVALALGVRLLAGIVVVGRLIRRGRALASPEWVNMLADATCRLNVRATPRLIMSDQVEMAFAFDALSPAIIIPANAQEWSDDRRRAVLLHELAHIRRRDLVGHTIAGIACAVYWFNPFIWTAARRLRVESELASDDIVLGTGVRPSDYAQHLLDMVTSFGQRTPTVALAMARPRDFEGRLVAILDRAHARSALSRPQCAAAVGLFGLIAVTIGAAVPVPRANDPAVPSRTPAFVAPSEASSEAQSVSRSNALVSPAHTARSEVPVAPVTANAPLASGALATAAHATPATANRAPTLSTAAIASLRRYGTGGIINPMMMLLRESDSLALTGPQADSIATLNRRFMVRLNTIWAPVSAYYASHSTLPNESALMPEGTDASRATADALLEIVPELDRLLTPGQRRRVSALTSTYLDRANLAAIAAGTMNAPDGVFLPPEQLYGMRGRGRGGG